MFTSTFSTPFILSDAAILKKESDVTMILRPGCSAVAQYLFHIPLHTHTFTWFASTYSSAVVFLAKVFKKKSIIVLGGVDVAKIPEFQYGIWNSWWRSILVRYSLRNADVVLAVDESLKKEAMSLVPYNGHNIQVLPTGYDDRHWIPAGQKENIVLTVAHCPDFNKAKIKGIDFLIEIARRLPHVQFIAVGIPLSVQRQFPFPENVSVFDYIGQDNLLTYYQRAKIYLQPSLREGLPNTLCEAMLCECYPVGSLTGGIPTAIGDTGTVIPYGDIQAALAGITQGMTVDRCAAARKRIQHSFSLQAREQKLHEIIHQE
ncbi:MAG: glycosyltransferase family 4 protein [Bacteroidota bacterium]